MWSRFKVIIFGLLVLHGLGSFAGNLCQDALLTPTKNLSLIFHTLQMLHAHPEGFNFLSPKLKNDLLKLSENKTDFQNSSTFKLVMGNLRTAMGSKTFDVAIGQSLQTTKKAVDINSPSGHQNINGARDMARVWGWRLLDEHDPIFENPDYLRSMLEVSNMSGTGGSFRDQTAIQVLEKFNKEWHQLSPHSNVQRFSVSGTDANNFAWEIANRILPERKYDGTGTMETIYHSFWQEANGRPFGKGNVISFEASFGGAYGPAKTSHFKSSREDEFSIPSPVTWKLDQDDPAELARLEQKESLALEKIERLARDPNAAVGALLLEPIIGASGVLFYRPEFILQVRELCDRYHIPIVVDEILTGGGRTGKFFAYEHYQGFEPDFITFGKGLQVAGIASFARKMPTKRYVYGEKVHIVGGDRRELYKEALHQDPTTTNFGISESLVKSTFVMKRIREGHLMENAEAVGAYFLKRLNEFSPVSDQLTLFGFNERPRGIGLLLFSPKDLSGTVSAMKRYMPYMSVTKEDIDKVFLQINGDD